jgi:hypothetical protein
MSEDAIHDWMTAHEQRADALLAEIDAHLERGVSDMSPAHLARGAELAALLEAHVARGEEFRLDDGDPHEAWRYALRRDGLRTEQAFGELSQSLVRRTHEFVRYFVDEGRAHRDALAKIVDSLPHEGALATARG